MNAQSMETSHLLALRERPLRWSFMTSTVRLLVCRYTDKHDLSEPDHLGVIPSHRRSLRGTVPMERVSLPDILHELREGRATYRVATVGNGRDKLKVEPGDEVYRVVDEHGAEHLSSDPASLSHDPLTALPTAEQLSRWFLQHCPTF